MPSEADEQGCEDSYGERQRTDNQQSGMRSLAHQEAIDIHPCARLAAGDYLHLVRAVAQALGQRNQHVVLITCGLQHNVWHSLAIHGNLQRTSVGTFVHHHVQLRANKRKT